MTGRESNEVAQRRCSWPEGYREVAPPPALASSVLRIWAYAIPYDRDPKMAIVVPDGCADIIWVDDASPVVVGPMTVPRQSWPAPGSRIVGVRFRPGIAGLALRESCEALTDLEVPLAELWGDRAARDLEAPHLDARWPDQVLLQVPAAMAKHFIATPTGDQMVVQVTDWLRRYPRGRLSTLADEVGISERQMRRRFASAVGYGPKTFQRIMRVQHCLARMQAGVATPYGDLATLALETGFVDQAHMTREFHRLTGCTPSVTTTPHATGWMD